MTDPQSPLERVRVVLVQPAGAANLGAVARAMKNFGLTRLWLVAPRCSKDDDEARRMAVHASDVLDAAASVRTLAEAVAECGRILGTTARTRTVSDPPLGPRPGAAWLLQAPPPLQTALVFGPEDRGLSNEELALCQQTLRIPTSPGYPSLNLAQAVAICAHELYSVQPAPPGVPPEGDPPATGAQLEGFYTHLERTLLDIGYLQEHTVQRKLEKFRRLFNRAALSAEEVALLRGILRQIHWASRHAHPRERTN